MYLWLLDYLFYCHLNIPQHILYKYLLHQGRATIRLISQLYNLGSSRINITCMIFTSLSHSFTASKLVSLVNLPMPTMKTICMTTGNQLENQHQASFLIIKLRNICMDLRSPTGTLNLDTGSLYFINSDGSWVVEVIK